MDAVERSAILCYAMLHVHAVNEVDIFFLFKSGDAMRQ